MKIFGLLFFLSLVSKGVLCLEDDIAVMKQQMTEILSEINNLKSELIAVKKENIDLKSRVDFLMSVNESIKVVESRSLKATFNQNVVDHDNNVVSSYLFGPTSNSGVSAGRRLQSHADFALPGRYPDEDLEKREKKKRLLVGTAPPSVDKVAFAVGLSKDVQLGTQQPIEYDKVFTNIGNGYDVRHGHFIAPRKGLYLLSFSAFGIGGESFHLEMVRNGARISIIFSPSFDRSCGSQTTATVLEQGDMVWVRHLYDSAITVSGHVTDYYNTFSGVIIFEL